MRKAKRIALYSHDTLGFGHFRRNLMLAGRLRELPGKPDVLLISGTYETGAFDIPHGIEVITLPAYAKLSDGRYVSRRLQLELAELRALRRSILVATLKRFAPDLFIVDNVPLGAQGELKTPLRKLRKHGDTHIVLGCRDILDHPMAVTRQWLRRRNVEAINRLYDQIWVYGDPNLYPVFKNCDASAITCELIHTGYLLKTPPDLRVTEHSTEPATGHATGQSEPPFILCTVGGGRDGLDLCRVFAASRLPEGHKGVVVPGSQMSQASVQQLHELASHNPDMTVQPFVSDLLPLMSRASRIVAMGGYNTTCEILALAKPALIVPRTKPRQEQLIRATALAGKNIVDICMPHQLSPDYLSDWMAQTSNPASIDGIDTGGLNTVAELAQRALFPSVMQGAAA